MAEEHREQAGEITGNFIERKLTEGLAGTGDDQYEFANSLRRGRPMTRPAGQGFQMEDGDRA